MVRIRGPTGWTPLELVEQHELDELNSSRERLLKYSGDKQLRGAAKSLPPIRTQVTGVGAGLTAIGALISHINERKDSNKSLSDLHPEFQAFPSETPKPRGLGLKRKPGQGLKRIKEEARKEEAEKRGLVVPPFKYLGPGNSLNSGKPYNQIDDDARTHDIEYSKAKDEKDIRNSDSKFISKASDHFAEGLSGKGSISNFFGAVIGGAGISIKHGIESKTGTIYPSNLGSYNAEYTETS